MKKILVIAVVALLVLAGCSSGSKSTPEESFKKAVESMNSAQTIDCSVASLVVTGKGNLAFDNFGKIVTEGKEDFSGKATVKAQLDGAYEDFVIYVSEGKFYVDVKEEMRVVSKEELLAYNLVDITLVNTLVTDYDSVTTEAETHTYVKEATDLTLVHAFSEFSHLKDFTVKEASMKQTIKVTKDTLVSNNIFITATYTDAEGVNYSVTQQIDLNYSASTKVDMPDSSEFK